VKLLLGVTGSVACYKSFDLLRSLVKKGHQVRVITTRGAEKFIRPELFHYLGASAVYSCEDDFNVQKTTSKQTVLHIELVDWCDQIVLAPLSANSLAKMAHGQADDLLSSVMLAKAQKPCLLFPAMNTRMWTNPMTQSNIKTLKTLPNMAVYSPDCGKLLCGDEGTGKFLEVDEITELIESSSMKLLEKSVLITTGATCSPLDPVRYLTNPSSGLTGFELAKYYLKQGHPVTVIAGINSTSKLRLLEKHPHFKLVWVKTTQDMYRQVSSFIDNSDLYISAAAISDIEFDHVAQKIKKQSLTSSLPIKKAQDVLAFVLKNKKSSQQVVSFAAETDSSPEIYREKIQRKPVDLMVGNIVSSGLTESSPQQGFQANSNKYFFVTSDNIRPMGELNKKELAQLIYQHTETPLHENH
jgi:phosphopantothenoylcysteine decarboxylase/phosphopantothenate--cysteine ligase